MEEVDNGEYIELYDAMTGNMSYEEFFKTYGSRLPEFAESIIESEGYSEDEKGKFITHVLYRYMTNEEDRKKWENKKISFYGRLFAGIFLHNSILQRIIFDQYPGYGGFVSYHFKR